MEFENLKILKLNSLVVYNSLASYKYGKGKKMYNSGRPMENHMDTKLNYGHHRITIYKISVCD